MCFIPIFFCPPPSSSCKKMVPKNITRRSVTFTSEVLDIFLIEAGQWQHRAAAGWDRDDEMGMGWNKRSEVSWYLLVMYEMLVTTGSLCYDDCHHISTDHVVKSCLNHTSFL